MFNVVVDYPSLKEEELILSSTTKGDKPELAGILSSKAILNLQKLVDSVPASDHIIKYVARLVRATAHKTRSLGDQQEDDRLGGGAGRERVRA